MFFKTMEIQGFKSFADKTVLNFDKKMTAIVGSNGNGKSNISDALRWVMGEQGEKRLGGTFTVRCRESLWATQRCP